LITQDLSSTYVSALKSTGATISLQTPPALNDGSEGFAYYHDCLLKLLTFKMHHIDSTLKRVIVLDSDQLVLKPLDHLFDMDDLNVDLAAPRAYWIAKETFSTAFLVITLSDRTWRKVETALENVRVNQYDMDMANELFGIVIGRIGIYRVGSISLNLLTLVAITVLVCKSLQNGRPRI
jgi:alpha-N-acetylglucosamine transferase